MSLLKEFTNALDCCGTCAGGVLNRYRAEAWDQGYEAAAPEYVRTAYRGNPYRPTAPEATQ